jgi:O-antigen ligase
MIAPMAELAARLPTRPPPVATRTVLVSVAAATLGALAFGMAVMLNGLDVSVWLAALGGLALVGFTLLAVYRYDTAVVIGLLGMGFVRYQPAPTDAAFAVIMVVAGATGRFRLARVPLIVRWLVGLLLIVNVLSFIDVVELKEAFQFFFITAYLLVFSVWFAGYLDSRARARTVTIIWLAVGVVSAVLAVSALYLPIPFRSLILSEVDGGERAAAFFKDPNVFGPFLVPIAVILLEQQISPRVPRLLKLRPLTFWVLLAILTLGVLFSYSRAAWGNYAIAVGVMLIALSIRRRGAQRAMKALIVLLATGAVAAVTLSATGSISFLEHRAQLQNYDTQRFAAQDFGWNLGWTHPIGIGPGQFRFHYPVESHSTFIRTFSEQGFPGLLLWIAILLVTLVIALNNVRQGRDTYGIGSAALLGAWCGLIFNSAVVDTLHWRHLWLVAALIWASRARAPSVTPREPRAVAIRPPREPSPAPAVPALSGSPPL